MAEHGIPIEVKELYKIFGTNPGAFIDAVKQGMTKAETEALIREIFESWYSSLVRYAWRATGSIELAEAFDM